jgi:hypothetical protein
VVWLLFSRFSNPCILGYRCPFSMAKREQLVCRPSSSLICSHHSCLALGCHCMYVSNVHALNRRSKHWRCESTATVPCNDGTRRSRYASDFRRSVYISGCTGPDCHDTQSTVVLEVVRVMKIFILRVAHATRLCVHMCIAPRSFAEATTGSWGSK